MLVKLAKGGIRVEVQEAEMSLYLRAGYVRFEEPEKGATPVAPSEPEEQLPEQAPAPEKKKIAKKG